MGARLRALGDEVLEVGPGFGATTDVFRTKVGHLTAVEIDPKLAGSVDVEVNEFGWAARGTA